MSITISDLQFTTSKRAISSSYILIMDIILMKDSKFISDMLYILQHFNLNLIPFLIVNTVIFYNYCPKSPSDYCENFELAWKETIEKLIWNMCGFWKYYHVLGKHWQLSCSIVNVRMRRHGLGKLYLQE